MLSPEFKPMVNILGLRDRISEVGLWLRHRLRILTVP